MGPKAVAQGSLEIQQRTEISRTPCIGGGCGALIGAHRKGPRCSRPERRGRARIGQHQIRLVSILSWGGVRVRQGGSTQRFGAGPIRVRVGLGPPETRRRAQVRLLGDGFPRQLHLPELPKDPNPNPNPDLTLIGLPKFAKDHRRDPCEDLCFAANPLATNGGSDSAGGMWGTCGWGTSRRWPPRHRTRRP